MLQYSRDSLIDMLDGAYSMRTRLDERERKIVESVNKKEVIILDCEMSVRWNLEEAARLAIKYNEKHERLLKEKEDKIAEVIDLIKNEYIKDNLMVYTSKLINIIWNKAYEEGHSYGSIQIFNYIDEYVEFANEVVDAATSSYPN